MPCSRRELDGKPLRAPRCPQRRRRPRLRRYTGSVQRGSIRPSKLHDGGKGQNPVYALQDLLNGAGTWGTALSICATTQLSVNPPHTYNQCTVPLLPQFPGQQGPGVWRHEYRELSGSIVAIAHCNFTCRLSTQPNVCVEIYDTYILSRSLRGPSSRICDLDWQLVWLGV